MSLQSDRSLFNDRYFVVTGSTQGLGAQVAELLVNRGAAGVVICGRSEAKGQLLASRLSKKGCSVIFVQANLGAVDDCRRVIATAKQAFGALHGLVNCAALTDRGSILDTTPELFDSMFNLNVKAPFFLIQETIKLMMDTNIAGSIVNIQSMSGHGGQSFLCPYSISKGALAVLTKNVAFSVLRNRIRVNGLNIGWMDTPHEHDIQTQQHGAPENWLEVAEAKQPSGRLLKPLEVARAVCFLLSDESGMMTGAVIDMDQGVLGCGNDETPRPESPLPM
jgi:NAD(P)-dependent dehydrogenase (short-subunit alcohol dehydrogenase family)